MASFVVEGPKLKRTEVSRYLASTCIASRTGLLFFLEEHAEPVEI